MNATALSTERLWEYARKIQSMNSSPHWVVLAQVLRPQGRKGEVLAELLTDFPERFQKSPRVWLARAGFADRSAGGAGAEDEDQEQPAPAEVTSHWLPVGRNAGRIVLKLAGVDSIEHAELLAGKEVLVPLAERVPLDADAAYISDLIGCTVYDRGQRVGVVEGVEFPATSDGLRRLEDAAPLLAITSPEGDEILVPFARAYLLEMDVAGKTIRMALPGGLAEVNKS